jgi:hypothetical protein
MEPPTTRLGLVSKPTDDLEDFEAIFPAAYAADIQKIDDIVQIAIPAAVGKMPVYDVNGFLISSGIAPADIEVGLLDSILTSQGMLLYRDATDLAALAADTAGKSLLTQGPAANPVFGYPSHGTLLNLNLDHHTQYVLRSLLTARGSIPFRGATVWEELVKGTSGYFLKQGANDPAWAALAPADTIFAATAKILARKTTAGGAGEECSLSEILDFVGSAARGDILYRGASTWTRLGKGAVGQRLVQGADDPAWTTIPFEVAFPFGDGSGVLVASNCFYPIPIACKITKAEIRSVDSAGAPLAGSVTCTLYKHARGAALGTLVDAFAISTATDMEETGLNIAVAAGNYLTVVTSGITTCKQIVCTLTLEPT